MNRFFVAKKQKLLNKKFPDLEKNYSSTFNPEILDFNNELAIND